MHDDDPTGHPHPGARSRPRRRRLLAAAVVGAVTLGLAAPAGALILEPALDSGGWWQPPPGVEDDSVSPVPVEPAARPALPQDERAQQAERQMQEAVDDVRALLAGPRCAAHIGGTPDGHGHPLDVFNAMVAADNPRAIYNTWSEDHGTSRALGGRLDDEGGRPVIQVFRRFHEVEVPAWTYNRYQGELNYELTPRQGRALVMLHEMRHVQETSDATHNGSAAAENEAIIAHCMPGAGQEPNSTYIPEGGEVSHPANDDDRYWYADEFAY